MQGPLYDLLVRKKLAEAMGYGLGKAEDHSGPEQSPRDLWIADGMAGGEVVGGIY